MKKFMRKTNELFQPAEDAWDMVLNGETDGERKRREKQEAEQAIKDEASSAKTGQMIYDYCIYGGIAIAGLVALFLVLKMT